MIEANQKKIFCSYSGNEDEIPLVKQLFKDLRGHSDINLIIDQEIAKQNKTLGTKDIIDLYRKTLWESDYFLILMSDYSNEWDDNQYENAYWFLPKEIPHIKIIKIAISKYGNLASGILGVGRYGTVIGLGRNYEKGLTEVLQALELNETNQLADLNLDVSFIKSVSQINAHLINKLSINPVELKTFDRRLFEELIAELFWGFGFNVELTKQTRDGGRDIIAVKQHEVELKYLIECKRPEPNNLIGIKPVRELFGVKSDEKASKAILATTSYFTKDALHFFERNKWELELKDFDGILKWIEEYKKIKRIN